MLRTVLLSLTLFVSLSSTSLLRKSISRRQSEPEYCHAIEGFDCKCTYYRVTCTSERDLPSAITVLPNEKQKYQSVELVINGEREQNVYDYTFEPVKQLFKEDADNLEFRIKFEKFTGLNLASSGIFNRVFPDHLPSTSRKSMALEIYNPLVQPKDDVNLFSNLHVDSLELYVLYPFRGTFQQLFSGANIKYLRLSGGDIRSDLSQPFTGTIGRLELAKQASELSIQNFPAYPAHELIINAFYVSDFASDHPPNYSNLGELRVYSQGRIPENAFRQFPNLHTLSIASEQGIDSHALDGLNNLEKLTIKDTKPSLEFLNALPQLKEFEGSIEKLSEREQCDLIEKLANGQVAVQAIPNGYECTCASAFLDTASGRYPCDAQNCEQSACPSIRNNYDAETRTFKTPPPVKRADGSNALRPRDPKVYTSPYQVSHQDQEKVQKAVPHHAQQTSGQDNQGQADAGQSADQSAHTDMPHDHGQHEDAGEQGPWSAQQPSHPSDAHETNDGTQQAEDGQEGTSGEGGEQQAADGHEKHQDGEGAKTQQEGEAGQEQQSTEAITADDAAVTEAPAKKGFNWLLLIIIIAIVAVVLLLLIGLIVLLVRKKRPAQGYSQAATSEKTSGTTTRA